MYLLCFEQDRGQNLDPNTSILQESSDPDICSEVLAYPYFPVILCFYMNFGE